MRVHQRNAVLSYDGSGPILRDTVKSGISKSGVSTALPSYGHGDLRGGHAGFRKAESPPTWWPTHIQRERFIRIDLHMSLISGSIL